LLAEKHAAARDDIPSGELPYTSLFYDTQIYTGFTTNSPNTLRGSLYKLTGGKQFNALHGHPDFEALRERLAAAPQGL